MIPVTPQPEPASFENEVRTPGLKSLSAQGIDLAAPLPPGTALPPYWRRCLDELHASYEGVCAYLGVYIERATGAASTDHFVAKSAIPNQAYEWSNYRLACLAMNSRKNKFDDVLDPFTMPPDLFRIELTTGRIYYNKSKCKPLQRKASETIVRLDLDSGVNRNMRVRHFSEYIMLSARDGAGAKIFFRRFSPFVWTEIIRQGL